MSKCSTTAYFGKDNELYLKYSYSSNYSYTATLFGTDDVDCSYDRGSTSNLSISVTINSGEDPLFNGSSSDSSHGQCCGLNCCYGEIGGEQTLQSNTSIVNSFFETVTTSTPSKDYNDDCGVVTTTSSNGNYAGDLIIVDGNFCSCGVCANDYDYEIMQSWGIESGHTQTQGFGTLTFSEKAKTYNSLGQIVSNPIPETAYNVCNPIRIANAPGCHFFAP
jgi:hypothetical protein